MGMNENRGIHIVLDTDPTVFSLTWPSVSGEKTELRVDCVELVSIRPEKVNELLMTNASQFMFYAAVGEALLTQVRELRNLKEATYARLDAEHRKKWSEASDGKMTNPAVESKVKTSEDYIQVVSLLEAAEHDSMLVNRVKDALVMQKDNLATLSSNLRAAGDASLGILPLTTTPSSERGGGRTLRRPVRNPA
jgi:hypothetical protein